MQQIIDYVRGLLLQGYSKEQLRPYLRNYYPQSLIDSVFLEIDKQNVKNYIFHYIKQGYGVQQVKNYMFQYFDNKVVSDVFDELFPKPAQSNESIIHRIEVSKPALAFAAIVLFIVLFGGLGVYLLKGPQKLLDIKVTKKDYTFIPGQQFEFTVDLINEGAKTKYDVALENTLVSLKNQQIIDTKREEFAIYTSEERTGRLYIPKDIAKGKYIVESTVSWDNQRRTAYFMIEIEKDGTISQEGEVTKVNNTKLNLTEVNNKEKNNDNNNNQNPNGNQPSNNSSDGNLDNKNTPVVDDPGDEFKKLSYTQQLNTLKTEAEQNPESAFLLCEYTLKPDYCKKEIAIASKKIAYCQRIENQASKDSCMLGFAKLNNDYSVCDTITTEQIKSDCNTLKSLNEMIATIKQNKEQNQN